VLTPNEEKKTRERGEFKTQILGPRESRCAAKKKKKNLVTGIKRALALRATRTGTSEKVFQWGRRKGGCKTCLKKKKKGWPGSKPREDKNNKESSARGVEEQRT